MNDLAQSPSSNDAVTTAADPPLYVLDLSRGLGSNQIHRIALDRQERIWLATPVGLSCFDGNQISVWDRANGLNCNGLRTVTVDSLNRTWVGTDLGVELIDAHGKIATAFAEGIWAFGVCQQIATGFGNYWLGTALGLIRLAPIDGTEGFVVDYIADAGFIQDVVVAGESRVLAVSASMGLIESDGHRWWRYRCSEIADRSVTRIGLGARSEILVGTDIGVYVIEPSDDRVVTKLRCVPFSSPVSAIAATAESYWVAAGRSLTAYSSVRSEHTVLEHFMVDSSINDLKVDSLGNVWAATNTSGLVQVSCLRHAMQHLDVGKSGAVYAIRPAPDGRHMIGGEDLFGTTLLDAGHCATPLECPDGLPETIVWDGLYTQSGIWAATQAGLFFAPYGGSFSQIQVKDSVLGAPNRVLQPCDGALLVGTLGGLTRLQHGVAESMRDSAGASLGYVYCMHMDASSTIWIGTLGRGLWRLKNGLQSMAGGLFRAEGNTYAIAQGPDGRIAVVEDEKIVLLAADLSQRLVVSRPPVAAWSLLWMDSHRIALGTSKGLLVVDVDRGRDVQLVNAVFRLRDWEFTNNRTLCRSGQDHLLCGLSSGLVCVDLTQLEKYQPPTCKLLDIVWTGSQPGQENGVFQIRPGRWSVRIRAYSAWFVDFAQVRYQFQLIGFDPQWSEPTDRPEIYFTSLPAGDYQLKVRAFSPLAGMGPERSLFDLRVSGPLWALGWSATLAFFERIYEGTVRARNRNQSLRDLNQRLEQEVLDRTLSLENSNRELQEVRDAFRRLSEVDELTQLGNRRRFDLEYERATALGRRLQSPFALLMIDIDYFKKVNDRYGHLVGDTYLRAVAQALAATIRSGEDTATRFGGEEFAVICFSTGLREALQGAERVRAAVKDLALPSADSPHGVVTVSIGIAVLEAGQAASSQELLARADGALYRAKHLGRNRVCIEE